MLSLKISHVAGPVMAIVLAALGGCASVQSRHALAPSDLGDVSRTSAMAASLGSAGQVTFQRIAFAHWTAGRGTFIDRDDPRTAAVPQGMEEATIYAYVLDHPQFGRFMIDSGVSRDLEPRLNPLMRRGLQDLDVRIEQSTADWLADETPPRAVFLTHLHFDHVGGLMDLPQSTLAYVGPGEARDRALLYRLTGRPADIALDGYGPLREWRFEPDPDGVFDGVIDIFGDGSVWAIHLPGHSRGSTGYLINAVDGPRLVVGDAVQTRLGWEQGMPQPLSGEAQAEAQRTLDALRAFVAAHPQVEIFLGHQSRTGQADS